MIISKKAIPRRTVLRGMGAMLALPLFDSMVPALSATLGPLAPFRDDVLVVSGLNSLPTRERPGGAHAKASTRFLTNVSPPTSETWLDVGISMDQILANSA